MGAAVAQQSEVLIWEKSKRPKGKDGKHDSLHMKCAITDSNDLLISSANNPESLAIIKFTLLF
ncbi:MAG: hypothetical protein HC833_07960 [Leptolyngbyaceae cyanobacterium RM1_406_9]|nr:hypothetical protein [Leptolyngbyaceae cyanobacterium RM1_406_9]